VLLFSSSIRHTLFSGDWSSAVCSSDLALQQNISLFYAPPQIANGEVPDGVRIRAGGMVKEGSLKRTGDSLDVEFVVHDGAAEVAMRYRGILPDLFREGQGIVALGRLNADGVLVADEVLAK